MISEIKKLSPAKINLYLSVKEKRKDGYHNIESLMTFCDYGDILTIKKSRKFSFSVNGPFADYLEDKTNLIELALKKLEDFYRRDFKIDILLTKKLPISSGMGGGSSNAATFIKCAEKLFELKPLKGFHSLLISLGADVPFCYYGKTALVEGIGEKINFTEDLKEYYVLLINPKIEISTKDSFNSFHLNKNNKNYPKVYKKTDINFLINSSNDLEAYAVQNNKIIGDIISHLETSRGSIIARMTGSGSTCFALFDNKKDMENARDSAIDIFKSSWIVGSRLVNSVEDI